MKKSTIETAAPPVPQQMLSFNLGRLKLALMLSLSLALSAVVAAGATIVPRYASGAWNLQGSPYVLIDHCTVDSGQTLTIEPGVTVIIGSNLTFTINGLIQAIGTRPEPITFRGANSVTHWDYIRLNQTSGSIFQHCNFSDANTGLVLYVSYNNTMEVQLLNCSFSNCLETCLLGDAEGWGASQSYNRARPTLMATVKNCRFENAQTGCKFRLFGSCDNYCGGGKALPVITSSIFRDLSGTALDLTATAHTLTSPTLLRNSIVDNCRRGVASVDYFDVSVSSCIFRNTDSAITRTGSLSGQVGFNCFFNSATNFVGYPSSYGQIVFANRNGTPCDVAYNIYSDPQFEAEAYLLKEGSPCIDGGDTAVADVCFPPSQGSSYTDMGAYGGPDACQAFCVSPQIVSQPSHQNSCVGESVSLTVAAVGGEPLSYQWYLGDQALAGATGATLTLGAIQEADAGSYRVVVTNYCGSVTSRVATVTVAPICFSVELYAGLTLKNLEVGRSYAIQCVANLSRTEAWTELTRFTATAPDLFWLDPEPARLGRRFYRVVPAVQP